MSNEPHYTRSTVHRVPLSSMAYPHLVSAHAKRLREDPTHPENAAMASEIARREAAGETQ